MAGVLDDDVSGERQEPGQLFGCCGGLGVVAAVDQEGASSSKGRAAVKGTAVLEPGVMTNVVGDDPGEPKRVPGVAKARMESGGGGPL